MRNRTIQCLWEDFIPTKEDIDRILADHRIWLDSRGDYPQPHNLRKINLQTAKLQGADLSEINLRRACLVKCDLTMAHLSCADLTNANMTGAKCVEAGLIETILINAILFRANLREAFLTGANLTNARAEQVNFHGSDLGDAKLQHTYLVGSNFRDAGMTDTDLSNADLRGTDFTNARVDGVIYKGLKSCRGIKADSCFGSPLFKRYAMDQDYIEEVQAKWPRTYRIWRISSDCGRSFLLWAAWALGLALVFAFIYWGFFEGSFKVPPELGFDLWTMTYYSVVTFTTLGFGDVTPITFWASVLVTIDVILGYLMLGGLISIFANKFARRAG